jgi:hypothetical protein
LTAGLPRDRDGIRFKSECGQYIGTVRAVDAEAAERAAIKDLGVTPEDQNRIMVREQE